jgi:hypothetical protein
VEKPAFKVPEKWPADIRARFEEVHKLAPDHAQWVLDQFNLARTQFGELEKSKQTVAQRAKILDSVEQLLAPGRQQRALQNIDDAAYVRNLVAAGDYLDKNPQEGLKLLAKQYGIDLQQLVNGQPGGEELHPVVRQQQEELASMRQAFQSFMGQQQQQQLAQVAHGIESFAQMKDPNGQPLYPHFDELLPEIIVNVQAQKSMNQAVDLDAAYKRAERMNDNVWQRRQLAQAESARKAEEERQRQAAEEAKRAGFRASGSGSAPSTSPADTLRGEIERHFNGQ